MVDSSFVWEERFETVYASPHDGDGVAGEKWRPREAIAAGTLQTTAADYALFLRAVVTDGLLGKEATERMLTPHSTIDDELGWALGWGVETTEDGTVFWQWGDDGSFKALAAGSRARRARGERRSSCSPTRNGGSTSPVLSSRTCSGRRRFLDFRMVNYR